MNQNMNTFSPPWLQATEPDNIYQKRIKYGRILLVWIVCLLVGTALVGMVVIGLFAPSLLWIVAVACSLLLIGGIVTVAFIAYWAFRSYQLTHPIQSVVDNETQHTKQKLPHVVDAQVHIIEVRPEDKT